MDHTKKKGQKKVVIVICIVLVITTVLGAGLTAVSHGVYHRSDMATLSEVFLRITGTKRKFVDAEKCAAYIEERGNAEPYTLDTKLKSAVSEETINGSMVYPWCLRKRLPISFCIFTAEPMSTMRPQTTSSSVTNWPEGSMRK